MPASRPWAGLDEPTGERPQPSRPTPAMGAPYVAPPTSTKESPPVSYDPKYAGNYNPRPEPQPTPPAPPAPTPSGPQK